MMMIAATTSVRITTAERDDLEWAFGAMADYWGADCVDGQKPSAEAEGVVENDLTVPDHALMPFIDGDRLALSTWDEVNDDLLDRIETQLPNMADNAKAHGGQVSHQRAGQIAARCERLASKIRDAIAA